MCKDTNAVQRFGLTWQGIVSELCGASKNSELKCDTAFWRSNALVVVAGSDSGMLCQNACCIVFVSLLIASFRKL